jgi:signal transduction histidine kinase
VWSPDAAPLAFTVASPIWRRPWFALTVFGLITGAVLVVAQVRVARLRRAQAMQADFSRQLISSHETERKRLAGELHDGLGQQLLIIGNWARLALNAPPASDQPRSSLQMITDTATESIREIRALTRELEPYNIEYVGLREALDTMLQRMGEASGVTFATDIDPVDGLLPADGGINLYRIVQEAANNIVKHAQASSALVTLKRRPHSIHLSISDDGRGLPPGASASPNSAGGFGLRSLAARTRLLGGRHQIESKPGAGTTITVEIPVGAPPDSHAS